MAASSEIEEVRAKKRPRKEKLDEEILQKYHQAKKLKKSILKSTSDDPTENSADLTLNEEVSDEVVASEITASQQAEVEQVLNEVNEHWKEDKKKASKKKKEFKQKQQELNPEPEAKESKQDRAIAYLKQWKKHRDEWKFKKTNHIWLLHNWKSSNKLSDKRFKTFLKYLKSYHEAIATKSLAIKRLEDEAKLIVDQSDQSTPVYERARSVLQWIE